MTLTARHRWCVSKIEESFGEDVTDVQVHTFMREDANLQKFNAFFHGEAPNELFVYFQPHGGNESQAVHKPFLSFSLSFLNE